MAYITLDRLYAVFFYIIFAVFFKQHGVNIGIITSLKIASAYIR